MPRLLSRHHPRFTEDGLFFYALLGVVALGERVARFVAEPNAEAALEPAAPSEVSFGGESGVTSVRLAFLGMLSVRRRVVGMIAQWAAQGEPTELPRPERALQGNVLK